MMEVTDLKTSALADRLQRGDRSVMAEIYDAYGAALYGVILRIVRNEVVAEDILQETFLRVWTKRAAFDGSKGTFFTWMLNVARNLAIDHLRSAESRLTDVGTADAAMDDDGADVGAVPFNDTIDLRQILEKLPAEQRQIIDLVYYMGYTQQEIAKDLNIPLGTVKSRIRLAMNALRTIYGVAP